jgi:hypothetical protein
MVHRKTQLAAAVGAALVAFGTAAVAQAPAAATVQVYGQVSRTLMNVDDGVQNKWFHVDNEASGTRFGVTGTGQAIPGLRAGFRIEVDLQSNESQRVGFRPTGPQSNFPAHDEDVGGFAERHMDAWLEGAWGRLNIGQGDGAANGATESDLSGTGMANGIGVADIGGGVLYRTSAGAFSAVNVNASINQQDFESRYDRLMYVTPTFGGFRAQVSWGQKADTDAKEISAWYGAKLGAFGELAAAAGWSTRGGVGVTKDEYVGGSVSWLHGSGLNVTFSYSNRDIPVSTAPGTAGRDSTFMYGKVGWKFGQHAIAVDYAQGEDFAGAGDEAKMMGIGYVWNPIRWLELYAAYKIHELDRPATAGGSMQEINIGHIGTRVRF